MSLLLRIGYRNLWRNRRRTLLTMSAMGTATALLVLFLGIQQGMMRDAITSATGVYVGDAKITATGYLARRQLDLTLPSKAPNALLKGDPEVKGFAGRVRGFALLSVGAEGSEQTQPAELLGIDPTEEKAVSQLSERIVAGKALAATDTKEIVLGAGLAKRLGASLGSEVVAMGQGADGSTAAEVFRVSGLVGTGDVAQDATLALVGRRTLQAMLALDGQVHEWTVALRSPMKASEWAKLAAPRLPDAEVSPWQRLLPQLASALEMKGASEFMIGAIFYFAVLMVSINTLTMALMERKREFAVMGALGVKPRQLWRLMVLEGGLMSLIAGLVGGLAGAAASFALMLRPLDLSGSMTEISLSGYTLQPMLSAAPSLANILVPTVSMMLLGFAIAAVPAWRISHRRPVAALREV